MTEQEAREILLRYRPGHREAQEPEVREALEVAAAHPELSAWLAQHLRFQETVRRELGNLDPPPGLKEQILSERRAAFGLTRVARRMALVGVAVVLGGLIWVAINSLSSDPEQRFATYRSRMVSAALRGYSMDVQTNSLEQIRDYLAAQNAHGDWQSPPALEREPLLGCAVLKWRGEPSTMICYGQDGQPGLWLFVVNSGSFPDPPEGDTFARVNRLNTLSWSSDSRTYVLAGQVPEAELRRLAGLRG